MSPSAEALSRHPLLWPYRLAMSVIVAGALTFGSLLSYIFWPVQVVYIDTPVKVETPTVRAGGTLTLHVRYSKPYEAASMVGVMYASEGTIALGPVGLSSLPPGDHDIHMLLQVPPALPPGQYVAVLLVERQVRLPLPALFDRPVRAASVPFTVLP